MNLTLLAAVAALTDPTAADLSWMAGYWLDCDGKQVAESWIDAGSDVLLGANLTRGGQTHFEFMRIAAGADGVPAFYAQPNGAQATAFPLVSLEGQRAIFENPGHDFPQRVIYARDGDVLTARIEGTIDGETQSVDWTYQAAELNARCPES